MNGLVRLRHTLALLLLLPAYLACGGGDGDSPMDAPEPAAISISGGQGQSAEVGAELGQALQVLVTDDDDQPMEGVSVSWSVTSGGGSVSPAAATTGADGMASATWTLGGQPGSQSVQASVSGLSPVTFNATAMVGAPASVSVTPATGTLEAIGATAQLSASAEDAFGNTLSNVTATWSTDDEAVATVSGTGLVTAVANGSARITAAVAGVQGSADVTVAQVVTSVTVEPASLDILVGETGQLNASLGDANGHPVDAVVSWSSDDEAVATVDASALVTGQGEGSAVVTASADDASATAAVTVTAQPDPFTPSQDTTLTGDVTVMEVDVPDGITVTLEGDATLISEGPVTIAGTVTGDCTEFGLMGQDDVTITGSVSTECSQAVTSESEMPALQIMSAGLLTLNGATITSGGDLSIGNPGVGSDGGALRAWAASSAAEPGCHSEQADLSGGFGSNGNLGDKGPGGPGGDVNVTCAGEAEIGGTAFRAGRGGTGGDANAAPEATAFPGGPGGSVNITVGGDRLTASTEMEIHLGDGGLGGHAIAASEDPAVKAMGTGGDGGDTGILSLNAPIMGSVSVIVDMGRSGSGGTAFVKGALGLPEHRDGGDAEARGGAAGDVLFTVPTALGSSSATLQLEGGVAGNGGSGHGELGIGRDGDEEIRDGGNAGDLTAFGGPGGSVEHVQATPGKGGFASFLDNIGGRGFDGCPTFSVGGNGGRGGNMAGSPGAGGFTPEGQTGNPGGVIYSSVANGDAGGDGTTPGAGGDAGGDGVAEIGAVSGKATSFNAGQDGSLCKLNFTAEIVVTSDRNGHEPFIEYTSISTVMLMANEDGTITFLSNDGTWVPLNGTLEGDDFTASGTGTVADFDGIPVSISGTLTRDEDGNVTGFDGMVTIDGTDLPPNEDDETNDAVYDISASLSSG